MAKKLCEMCIKAVTPAKDGDCPFCGAGLQPIPRGGDRDLWRGSEKASHEAERMSAAQRELKR